MRDRVSASNVARSNKNIDTWQQISSALRQQHQQAGDEGKRVGENNGRNGKNGYGGGISMTGGK